MMDRIESQTSGDIQKVEEKRYIYIHQFPYPAMTWAIYRPSNLQRRQIVLKPEQSLWYVLQHVVGQIPITENNGIFPFHYIYIHMWVSYCCCCHPVLAVFTYRSFNRVRATNASSSIWRIKLFFKSLGMWEKIGKN